MAFGKDKLIICAVLCSIWLKTFVSLFLVLWTTELNVFVNTERENFLIKTEYYPPTWKMLIIQVHNTNKASVFICVHARIDRELLSVLSREARCSVWSNQPLVSFKSSPHTPSDSLQRRTSPSPEVSTLAKEVGREGPPWLNWVTGPGHWAPNTIIAHIAGQVAMVTPLPASFHYPGRKPVSPGQAESEQIASWSKNGSF